MSGNATQLEFYMFSYDQGLRASALLASRSPPPMSEAEIKRRSRKFLLLLIGAMVVLPFVLTALIMLGLRAC